MQYKKLEGIILKKQNYKESDQIITIWTLEAGKIRALAKGVRLAKSKLVYSLQELSWATVEITGRNLPTIISVAPIKQFHTLTEDLKKTAIAFYAAELMLKMTADEHPNEQAFLLLKNFLISLDKDDYSTRPILENFCIELLDSLGFKIPQDLNPSDPDAHQKINKFIEYILERNIKSEPFLISI